MAIKIKKRCIYCRQVLREDGTCQNEKCPRYTLPKGETEKNDEEQQAQKLYRKGMKVCLTGGLSEFKYISDSLGKELKTNVEAKVDGRYAGAIGAALAGM